MKVIVGLGNPGAVYANTRHNAGVLLVDRLAGIWRRKKDIMVCETKDAMLVKSANIFMNESGRMVREFKDRDVWVAHDDLDIKLGEFKIQKGKGPKEHGGINSIESVIGKDFWRIRIGVDNRAGERESVRAGEEYVLQKFTTEERVILERVLNEIAEAIN